MAEKKPFEIVRETLLLLSSRKLAPTPVNFQTVYGEVAGTPYIAPFPEEPLREIAQAVPARTAEQRRQKALIESAIGQHDWVAVQDAVIGYVGDRDVGGGGNGAGAAPAVSEPAIPLDVREQIARLIENALPALGTDDKAFAEQAACLLKLVRDPACGIATLKQHLGNFNHRLSFAAEDQAEIREALLKLLHLIFQNINALTLDDRWLKPQIDALMASATPPLTLRRLDEVERRVRDVMFKQAEAKGRALEAQDEMRKMLAVFIERLAQLTESTSARYARMEESARLIEQARTLEEIAPVLKDVIDTTRDMAQEVKHSHDELRSMRDKVQTTEAEIVTLQRQLDSVSTQARHDALTGALNRKGLDEALAREVSDVKRRDTPLCLSLLDVDNFKKLNDSWGHETGDAALAHLAAVTRESMRPQDTLARYGGEEFVVLMPNTVMEQGMEAMMRLQRVLTRRFFLAGSDKVIITFSAGVAQLAPGESPQDAVNRADQAMYLAKRAGRNRVMGA